MSHISKALFGLFLLLIATAYIVYRSDANIIDVNKERYQEAIQSASQLATYNLIDTSAVNDLYDGVRKEDADIPINFDTLDQFRTNLSRLLDNAKGGSLSSISNINIPLVGYVTYDYIIGVTYGDEYKTSRALALLGNNGISSEDFKSKDLSEQYKLTSENRGTYLIPCGYTYYPGNVLNIDELSNKVWNFTLGDVIYITSTNSATLDESNQSQVDMDKEVFIVYQDDTIGLDGCTLARLDPLKNTIIDLDNDKKPDDDTLYDIGNFIRSIGFSKISELKEWAVMTSINEYLTMYSGTNFNVTSDNTHRGIDFSLSSTRYSSDKNDYTSNSSVITGPGMFAIVDLYTGSGSDMQLYDRMASFGGSELVKKTSSSLNTLHGNPNGSGSGSGGDISGPSDPSKPTTPTVPDTISISFTAGTHGSGTMKTENILTNGNKIVFQIPECTFTPDTNYVFDHWEDALGNKYYKGQVVTLTANLALRATWTDVRELFTITYHYKDKTYTDEYRDGTEATLREISVDDGQRLYGYTDIEGNDELRYRIGQRIIITKNLELWAVCDTAAELLVSASDEVVVYDGKEHRASVMCNDTSATITIRYYDSTGKQVVAPVSAGKYTVKIIAVSKYKSAELNTSITIEPKEIALITSSATKEYDGLALTESKGAEILGLVDGESATIVVTGRQVEVGESKNTAYVNWGTASKDNYTINESGFGTLTVTKKIEYSYVSITVTVNGLTSEELDKIANTIKLDLHEYIVTGDSIDNMGLDDEKEYIIGYTKRSGNTFEWIVNDIEMGKQLDIRPLGLSNQIQGKEYSRTEDAEVSISCDQSVVTKEFIINYFETRIELNAFLINYDIFTQHQVGDSIELFICLDSFMDEDTDCTISLEQLKLSGIRVDKATLMAGNLVNAQEELDVNGTDIVLSVPSMIDDANKYETIIKLDATVQTTDQLELYVIATVNNNQIESSRTWLNMSIDSEDEY